MKTNFAELEKNLMESLNNALDNYIEEQGDRTYITEGLLNEVNAEAYGSDNNQAWNDVEESFNAIINGADRNKELDELAEDFRFWTI